MAFERRDLCAWTEHLNRRRMHSSFVCSAIWRLHMWCVNVDRELWQYLDDAVSFCSVAHCDENHFVVLFCHWLDIRFATD